MAESQEEYLLKLWEKHICPFCGFAIGPRQRVGSGRKQDGGFCSLDCYTKFYELELAEKARLLAEKLKSSEG